MSGIVRRDHTMAFDYAYLEYSFYKDVLCTSVLRVWDGSDSFNLDQEIPRQLSHFDSSASRLGRRQHSTVHRIHRSIVAHVGQKDRSLHNVIPRGASLFQYRADVLYDLSLGSVSLCVLCRNLHRWSWRMSMGSWNVPSAPQCLQ